MLFVCPAITTASCIHLIVTSVGHLDCCYVSALIDCLPKSERVGCVCLLCFTNGHHLGTHLSEGAGSGGDMFIKERSTDEMRGIYRR